MDVEYPVFGYKPADAFPHPFRAVGHFRNAAEAQVQAEIGRIRRVDRPLQIIHGVEDAGFMIHFGDRRVIRMQGQPYPGLFRFRHNGFDEILVIADHSLPVGL